MVRFSFQVIKNQETPNIVCSFDNIRYIFNLPDGFQRFTKDNQVKINQGPRIFFTRLSTKTTTGCFGYLSTLLAQNCGVNTKIYGPKGLCKLINMKRYNEIGGFKTLPYSVQEFNGNCLLGTKDTKLIEELLQQNDCKLQEYLEKIKEHIIDPKESNDASIYMKNSTLFKDQNLQIQAIEINDTIQYVISSFPQPGNYNKEKLQQFKVPANKMQDLSKNGKVMLEDEQIVTIEQVKEPDIIPQVAIILDIANPEQMQKLMCHIEFKKTLEQFKAQQVNLVAVFHLSHQLQEEYYIDFIKKYSNINHIFCNYYKESDDKICQTHMKIQPLSELLSNFLHQQYPFNFPHIECLKLKPIPIDFKDLNQMCGYIPLFEYLILPTKQQGYKPVQNFSPKIMSQIFNNIQFKNYQQQFQQKGIDHMRLIFLGTCSMKPGQLRNVSGIILVNEKLKSNIILDCGEGTFKQISDENIVLDDKPLIIWISHAHSDHHLGLLQIVHNLCNCHNEIYLIVPAIVVPWLMFFKEILGEQNNWKIIVSQQFDQDFKEDINELIKDCFHQCRIRQGELVQIQDNQNFLKNYEDLISCLKDQFELNSIKVTPVDHCPQSYGVRLNLCDGRSLSYSGDTRPCERFIKLSQNVDILIHESTFTDDLQENALQNMHSTISEAVKVGMLADAKVITLTHYSQRYSRQIEINQENLENDKIIFCCDHFGGYLNQYSKLSQISKEIIQLFNE
ncbi:unnamed protein product [Paramecium octaurelia]|uniref:tRNase Z endonuclease domain-containing protein n=1 Tax=Paramecium octaurelia TaxID=43137 RepID=A0A8S1XYU0_PAROT|nr:unnamed protein product [Paramecium octaurelia]